jgi:phage portal protein BeeE
MMNFLERVASAQNLEVDTRQMPVASKQSTVFPELFFDYWKQLGAPREEGDIREFPKVYHQDNWVRRSIELRSESVSQVRLVARMQGSDDPLPPDHPAQRLLSRPNPWETWQLFIELAQTNIDSTGDMYFELVEDKSQPQAIDERTGMRLPRPPAEMYILRSDRMHIVPDERTYIGGYQYHLDHKAGDPIPFAPHEVLHMRYVNPTDDY